MQIQDAGSCICMVSDIVVQCNVPPVLRQDMNLELGALQISEKKNPLARSYTLRDQGL